MSEVLMLGTDINTMGGISSVVKGYIDYGIMSRLGVEYLPTHKDGTKITKILFYLKQFPKIVVRILEAKIIHIHSSHGWSFRRLSILLWVAAFFGKKTVLHVHGSQFDIYYANSGRIEQAVIRYGLRKADRVIVLSSAWKEKLLKIESNLNPLVLMNTVNVGKYLVENRQLSNPVNVLFLGRLGKRKGVYDILKAVQYIDRSRFRFVLAGDGDIDNIRKSIAEKGYGNFIEVPGWIDEDKKKELLRHADIYIMPSYQEGLPISILEAMAAGLPIISTPVGGIPDAVADDENGYLIAPGDYRSLADCITRIGMNQDLWKTFSIASRRLAMEKFSMERSESQLRLLYATIA